MTQKIPFSKINYLISSKASLQRLKYFKYFIYLHLIRNLVKRGFFLFKITLCLLQPAPSWARYLMKTTLPKRNYSFLKTE